MFLFLFYFLYYSKPTEAISDLGDDWLWAGADFSAIWSQLRIECGLMQLVLWLHLPGVNLLCSIPLGTLVGSRICLSDQHFVWTHVLNHWNARFEHVSESMEEWTDCLTNQVSLWSFGFYEKFRTNLVRCPTGQYRLQLHICIEKGLHLSWSPCCGRPGLLAGHCRCASCPFTMYAFCQWCCLPICRSIMLHVRNLQKYNVTCQTLREWDYSIWKTKLKNKQEKSKLWTNEYIKQNSAVVVLWPCQALPEKP